MPATVRPFDLPIPRGAGPATGLGLVEAPSPTIGALVCAWSTFDARGYNVSKEEGPMGIGGRIALASFLAILGGVLAGYPVALIVGSVLPASVRNDLGDALLLPPILICGVIAFILCFKRFSRGKPGASASTPVSTAWRGSRSREARPTD